MGQGQLQTIVDWRSPVSIAIFIAIWITSPLILALLCRSFAPYALPTAVAIIALVCSILSAMLLSEGSGIYRFNTTLTMIYHDKTALINHAHQLARLSRGYFALAAMTALVSWLGSARSRHLTVFGFSICHLGYAFPTLQPVLIKDPTTFADVTVQNAFAISGLLGFLSGAATILGTAILLLLVLVSLFHTFTLRRT